MMMTVDVGELAKELVRQLGRSFDGAAIPRRGFRLLSSEHQRVWEPARDSTCTRLWPPRRFSVLWKPQESSSWTVVSRALTRLTSTAAMQINRSDWP